MIRRINTREFNVFKVAAVIVIAFLFSCTQVKFVPEGKYIVKNVEVELDTDEIDKEEAKAFVKQKENYRILGFVKFHLWMYNLSSTKKTDDWLKRIGEPPQIYDEILSIHTEEQLKEYANNKGYFRSNITSEVSLDEKKSKASVVYKVETGDRYTIRDINYNIRDTALNRLFFSNPVHSFINKGDPYDEYKLEEQQVEIEKLFRNNGYFYFSKEDVKYIADSSSYSKQILLELYIDRPNTVETDSLREFKKYYLNDFYISMLPGNTAVTSNRDALQTFTDTLKWDNYILYTNNQVEYPAALFNRTMQMQKGKVYNHSSVESTFNAFNRLRQFRFVDIQFTEPGTAIDTNLLDSHIRLAPLDKQSTSFDLEGTNTAGNFGVAGNITYQHRNLFKGAEVFQIKFKGATERLQHLVDSTSSATESFNTKEFGVESNLILPKLIGPGNWIRNFEKFLPKTVLTLGYNYQERPEYTRTISSFRFGYDWKTTETLRHRWNLLDFNKVKVFEYDPEFIKSIDDLYIKSSFTDHLIMAMNYSIIYNNQKLETRKNYTYLRLNVESAGNFLWAISELADRPKKGITDSTGVVVIKEYYEALNTRFAQYVKTDFEVRHSRMIDEYNSIVGRAFMGIALPYGNFDVLPFEKKYFTGGANGIRAWQVRSLGPGSYKAPEGAYPNQTSDIKLEANIEYRFLLTGFLEGALFVDAGNIWAINGKDNRLGAQFKFNEFYKQIALGTGVGLRFDLNYFIFRLDLGMKLHDPASDSGVTRIFGAQNVSRDSFNLSFAIGYPF